MVTFSAEEMRALESRKDNEIARLTARIAKLERFPSLIATIDDLDTQLGSANTEIARLTVERDGLSKLAIEGCHAKIALNEVKLHLEWVAKYGNCHSGGSHQKRAAEVLAKITEVL